MRKWATDRLTLLSQESLVRFVGFQKAPEKLDNNEDLRYALLDFIADFANWDNSTRKEYLETSRALTRAAHEALGGIPGTKPLVVDPFAGGGSIPLEALRVGADAFASDLNPVAVLLNKVLLEYIPKYGQQLAGEVRTWGAWIKEQAAKQLAEFYPTDPDGATPIAYLWARTITCEGPSCGAGVPLMRSLWLAKKGRHSVALRLVSSQSKKRVDFEIIENAKAQDVGQGTVRRGSATCPVCGYTTPVTRVREQLKARRGGTSDARLFCVVTTRTGEQGRFYRLPAERDLKAVCRADAELERRKQTSPALLWLVPDEEISLNEIRRISVPIYGMMTWGDLFTPRQVLALTTLTQLVRKVGEQKGIQPDNGVLITARACLALALSKQVDSNSSICMWRSASQDIGHTFGRQAIPMTWDFVETNVLGGATRDWLNAIEGVIKAIESVDDEILQGQAIQASANAHPFPADSIQAFITDPPYYDAVPYSHLSDFFYVWLRRSIGYAYPDLFASLVAPKTAEIVVDRPHTLSSSTKDIEFYERELTKAFAEGFRLISPDSIGVIVFASKTTASWEAILKALIEAGWIITGSWPIDTEMETRVAAMGQARLGSSVHLICHPRKNEDGSPRIDDIGEWRDILAELPRRIHDWMPHLAQEGVVGADAIFACIGPALEIYSRYSRVEKASGDQVTLKEYLEHVWAAVAQEALSMIFADADATGFEEDARLTVIWFWVLKAAANGHGNSSDPNGGEESSESEEEAPVERKKTSGYTMEYDAARKLAQGLGADLRALSRPGGVVTIQGNVATLNSVASRERHLVGQQLSLFNSNISPHIGRAPKAAQYPSVTLQSVDIRQRHLFAEEPAVQTDPAQLFLPALAPTDNARSTMERLQERGVTVLDRLHQAMLLFGREQVALLGSFLQETHMGHNVHFW
jgi:adenine-specific DNA methylase